MGTISSSVKVPGIRDVEFPVLLRNWRERAQCWLSCKTCEMRRKLGILHSSYRSVQIRRECSGERPFYLILERTFLLEAAPISYIQTVSKCIFYIAFLIVIIRSLG
jgi:hypothetical protein